MSTLSKDLTCLKRAAAAVQQYPGAAAALKRLRRLFKRKPHHFKEDRVRDIRRWRDRLPKGLALVRCPACHGLGTQRRMVRYKHTCNVCGGWKMVPQTPEAVREVGRTWNR